MFLMYLVESENSFSFLLGSWHQLNLSFQDYLDQTTASLLYVTKDDNMTEYLLKNDIDLSQFNRHDLVASEFQNIDNNSSLFELCSVWPFPIFISNASFYKQLGSGLSPQSCLYFQGLPGSKLINGCVVVWTSNLCLREIQ